MAGQRFRLTARPSLLVQTVAREIVSGPQLPAAEKAGHASCHDRIGCWAFYRAQFLKLRNPARVQRSRVYRGLRHGAGNRSALLARGSTNKERRALLIDRISGSIRCTLSSVVIKCFKDKRAMANAAAEQVAAVLRQAIETRGTARLIAATGISQFEFLEALTGAPAVNWQKVEMFHLDEYIGLPASHPASFGRFLRERLIDRTGITKHFLLNGASEPAEVIRSVGRALRAAAVDVALVGIGENGHLAFNDPPADFATEAPYIVVELDEVCRRQQVAEGWFTALAEVPRRAISMSVRQILKSKKIVCIAPGQRKATVVKACLEGDISPLVPASILRTHPDTTLYLDVHSAALLHPESSTNI